MTAPVLRAHRTGFPSYYEITVGEAHTTKISAHALQRGGELVLAEQTYTLTSAPLGRGYRLESADGQPIASAERSGLRNWRIEAAGHSYQLAKDAIGRGDQVLTEGDHEIGQVRIGGLSGRNIKADLPTLDRPVALFVLILALARRQRRRRAVVIAR